MKSLSSALVVLGEIESKALVKVFRVPILVRILHSLARGGVENAVVLCRGLENIEKELLCWDIPLKITFIKSKKIDRFYRKLRSLLGDTFIIAFTSYIFEDQAVKYLVDYGIPSILVDSDPPVKSKFKIKKNGKELYFSGLALLSFQNDFKSLVSKVFDLEEFISNVTSLGVSILDLENASVYDPELKRRSKPISIYIEDSEGIEIYKETLFARAKKGKHFTSAINNYVENFIVKSIADTPLTPNHITLLVNILAYIDLSLLLLGLFPFATCFAYLIGILDGVDGKLARIRGVLTKLGYIEHSFDMLFEQALYAMFGFSTFLHGYGELSILVLTFIFLVSDGFVRHIYMQFKAVSGVALTDYSKFDRVFAKIDGRRNVYIIYMIIFSLLNLPQLAIFPMLAHSLITAVVYALRSCLHLRRLDRTLSFTTLVD